MSDVKKRPKAIGLWILTENLRVKLVLLTGYWWSTQVERWPRNVLITVCIRSGGNNDEVIHRDAFLLSLSVLYRSQLATYPL